MQISATPPAPLATGSTTGGPVAAQMRQLAGVIADGSTASTADQLQAWSTMGRLVSQDRSWFAQTTQAERDEINAIKNNAAITREIYAKTDAFSARGMAMARTTNVMADQIRHLDSLSPLDQQMIFVGTASMTEHPTIEGWKSFLQENADGRDKQLADEAAEKSAVKITLSDKAKAALDQATDKAAGADSAAKGALATLQTPDQGDGIADAALRMLRKAAEARAARDDSDRPEVPNVDAEAKPTEGSFRIGEKVDTSV